MNLLKMSNLCKELLIEEFGFTNIELLDVENFMNEQNQKTAKGILDSLMQDKKLSDKQKIVIAYVVGNSAREAAIQEDQQKGIIIDMSRGVPPIGG